jgi:hypothetical protein
MLDLAVRPALRALSLGEAEVFARRLFEASSYRDDFRQPPAYEG